MRTKLEYVHVTKTFTRAVNREATAVLLLRTQRLYKEDHPEINCGTLDVHHDDVWKYYTQDIP